MEECPDSSPVKGTIKQYINLIDKITDQELDMSYDKELIKYIYSKNLYSLASEFGNIWEKKDIIIAEIIAEKIKKQKEWNTRPYHGTTIFKNINNTIDLFFEPNTCAIGFYWYKGLGKKISKLYSILEDVNFEFLSKTEPKQGKENKRITWCYILFDYNGKKSLDSNNKGITIEKDYFDDINNALGILEKNIKKFK